MTASIIKTVRIYSPFNPYPPTEGAYQVISDQAAALKNLGLEVTIVHWKNANEREDRFHKGIRVAKSLVTELTSPEYFFYDPDVDPRASLPPVDLAIYHYSFAYAWLRRQSPELPHEAKRVVHFHNLESELFHERFRESLAKKKIHEALVQEHNFKRLFAHENRLPKTTDELWFVSQTDQKTFQMRNPESETRLVSPGFDSEVATNRRHRFGAQEPGSLYNLGIVGRFDFGPNRASLQWIIQKLAPALQEQGFHGKIRVAGRDISEDLRREASRFSFFEWLGFLPDLEDFWSSLSYLLVPQKGGSGIRIKLLEALASGVPVIANQEAILPLHPDLQKSPSLISCQNANEWTQEIMSGGPFTKRRSLAMEAIPAKLNSTENYRELLRSLN